MYVVSFLEQLRDGKSEWAVVVPTLEEALKAADDAATWKNNLIVRLFKLGEEVPLKRETVSEPQPPALRTCYKVK